MAAVEALQITSAAIVPLHFVDDPTDVSDLQSTPYTSDMQREDRFDGRCENDAKRPSLCRVHVPVTPRFVDNHVQDHIARHGDAGYVSEYKLSLTGSHLSKLPTSHHAIAGHVVPMPHVRRTHHRPRGIGGKNSRRR